MSGKVFNPKDNSYITISNTWLYYKVKEVNVADGTKVVHWRPYSIDNLEMLTTLKLALTGSLKHQEAAAFQKTYIRFGWLDKTLNSLEWVPLSEVLTAYKNKTLSKQQRGKLNHVCRLLFISIKDIRH